MAPAEKTTDAHVKRHASILTTAFMVVPELSSRILSSHVLAV